MSPSKEVNNTVEFFIEILKRENSTGFTKTFNAQSDIVPNFINEPFYERYGTFCSEKSC